MDLEGKEEGITVIHVFVVNSEPDRFNGNEWMTTILECKKAFGIDEVLNVAGIFFEKKLECRSWVIVIVVTVIIKVSFVDSLKGKG